MKFRRLRAGELDHEALWLGVSLASLALAWIWLRLALPLPGCVFHRLSGLPCPTCGATRCLRFVLHGDFASAFPINPLAFAALGAWAIFDFYAAAVLALKLPRLRFESSVRVRNATRLLAAGALAVNWLWLVRAHV